MLIEPAMKVDIANANRKCSLIWKLDVETNIYIFHNWLAKDFKRKCIHTYLFLKSIKNVPCRIMKMKLIFEKIHLNQHVRAR